MNKVKRIKLSYMIHFDIKKNRDRNEEYSK